jgi:hypothetical protein
MKTKYAAAVALGVIGIASSARAADMTGSEIKSFLSGQDSLSGNHRSLGRRGCRSSCDLLV